MLLQKNAGFRASVKDVLQLPSLASRVERFTKLNEEREILQNSNQQPSIEDHVENDSIIKSKGYPTQSVREKFLQSKASQKSSYLTK